jgi:hypothetical protein
VISDRSRECSFARYGRNSAASYRDPPHWPVSIAGKHYGRMVRGKPLAHRRPHAADVCQEPTTSSAREQGSFSSGIQG